ncbi:hypothetical protein [Burkholderia multivorans]|uniref:hypothetical protein n=1 Tax=Burkholderia multivorans TaxID=87883 RepID=UPI00143E8777|nr:hypothetical protein [Burkholderia multivorans]QIX18365.1 hypothetical protein FOB32_22855 [Burkholderia multivorans]
MIPPITDPLGRYWRQPPRSEILVDDEHAIMTRSTFEKLAEYSATRPSGVYPGKMWRAVYDDGAYLRWYGIVDGRPDLCSNNQRLILLVEDAQ